MRLKRLKAKLIQGVRKNILLSVSVVLLILTIDQILKIWIKTSFAYNDPSVNLIGDWFKLNYVENQGMAFGATLGGGVWGKLILSLFRIIAIGGIIYYLIAQIKRNAKKEFIVVISLVLAGATGNLIDSLFYDLVFDVDYCIQFNQLADSGIWKECNYGYGYIEQVEVRQTGFLFGNVVDMFQFDATWPNWVPWLGGRQVFPAIWNFADSSISIAVIIILFRQKKYFKKEEPTKTDDQPA